MELALTNSDRPDFIGIGAIKSGTSWLHACIAEHPEIYTPPTKEIEFFNRRYDLGIEWYLNLFSGAAGKTCGESTPEYFHDPLSAGRIFKCNANARLLLCLRNPIDRAFSHYLMDSRSSALTPNQKMHDFDELVHDRGGKYVSYGLYSEQLDRFLQYFPIEMLHVVLFEDIALRPDRVMTGVFRFLQVDDAFTPSVLRTPVNASSKYRNVFLFHLLRRLVQTAERSPLSSLVLKLKTHGVRDLVLTWARKPAPRLEMLPETRHFLERMYRKSNQRLESMLGRDTGW